MSNAEKIAKYKIAITFLSIAIDNLKADRLTAPTDQEKRIIYTKLVKLVSKKAVLGILLYHLIELEDLQFQEGLY